MCNNDNMIMCSWILLNFMYNFDRNCPVAFWYVNIHPFYALFNGSALQSQCNSKQEKKVICHCYFLSFSYISTSKGQWKEGVKMIAKTKRSFEIKSLERRMKAPLTYWIDSVRHGGKWCPETYTHNGCPSCRHLYISWAWSLKPV